MKRHKDGSISTAIGVSFARHTVDDVSDFLAETGHRKRDSPCGKAKQRMLLSFGPIKRVRGTTNLSWGATEDRLSEMDPLTIGAIMEDTADLTKAALAEAKESKHVLEEIRNQVSALADIIHPALINHISEIRTARMAVVSELSQSLTMLRDVRKFFLESNYEQEMERLERFIAACKEIQRLKAEGVFDAVCDSAIRMAVKETT